MCPDVISHSTKGHNTSMSRKRTTVRVVFAICETFSERRTKASTIFVCLCDLTLDRVRCQYKRLGQRAVVAFDFFTFRCSPL